MEKTVEKTVYVDKIVEKTVYVNVQDVYFQYDSSALGSFNQGILDRNAEVFKEYPKLKAILIGYASPEGTDEYNLKLSENLTHPFSRALSFVKITQGSMSSSSESILGS